MRDEVQKATFRDHVGSGKGLVLTPRRRAKGGLSALGLWLSEHGVFQNSKPIAISYVLYSFFYVFLFIPHPSSFLLRVTWQILNTAINLRFGRLTITSLGQNIVFECAKTLP